MTSPEHEDWRPSSDDKSLRADIRAGDFKLRSVEGLISLTNWSTSVDVDHADLAPEGLALLVIDKERAQGIIRLLSADQALQHSGDSEAVPRDAQGTEPGDESSGQRAHWPNRRAEAYVERRDELSRSRPLPKTVSKKRRTRLRRISPQPKNQAGSRSRRPIALDLARGIASSNNP